ncbi:thiamine pyrophosphate-binding protein [Paracoccaceae bacterium]|jgi:acetolactate synthase-1/2/3 large subunit|nr:thiamine pyrophosphate-binding protein [Paracoccaceae bacterium]|tara:strand:- start:7905 stop:9539 length:1635 start_codon:yes stop_codon:yes gene_type:complete
MEIKMRHGGQILIDQLKIQGVDRVFCIPGESYLPALDGLYESGIQTIVGRQEGGVAMMAEASGKLTGRPGIAFVTRGPGASNASAGIHIAFQDSTPMILFVGQVDSSHRDREAFQEVDYKKMFSPLAKWVAEIDNIERLPEYISRAFNIALSGRPGPVVLSLPEDTLFAKADIPDAPKANPSKQMVSEEDVNEVIDKLKLAKNPFIIVGGSGWSSEAAENLGKFAKSMGIPVGTSFRCQDYLDNRHPNYVGDVGIGINPALLKRITLADCVLVLNARLGEMTTGGYSMFDIPKPKQYLIHIHPDPNELGSVYQPDIGLVCNSAEFIKKAVNNSKEHQNKSPTKERANYQAWQKPLTTPGNVKMEVVIKTLSNILPEETIITNGAGNYNGWLHRYFTYKGWRTQVGSTSGSMGYGLPAAVAAKLIHHDKEVICLSGDGCFQMTMQEFGTACQYGLNIIIIISNNSVYGTIKMHQEKAFPGRPSGTSMVNPNFAELAKSYGGHGEVVLSTDQFSGALERARNSNKPAILDLRTDPKAINPQTLEAM